MTDHVIIELDKSRTLRFGWRAICRLHDEHGINILDLEETAFRNPKTISAVLWAGLVGEEPGLTLEQVQELIELPQLGYISEKVGEALAAATTSDVADPFAAPGSTPTPSASAPGNSTA